MAPDREELWSRESLKSHLLGPEGSPGRAGNSLILGATEGDRVEWILWLAQTLLKAWICHFPTWVNLDKY